MSAPQSDHPAPRVPLTPALSRLSEVIDGLDASRSRAARAYAEQQVLFGELIPIVRARREERIAAHANPRHQKVPLADREVIADVAAALRLSERVVHSRISRARELTAVFPLVHGALAAGRIDPAHADVICEVGTVLDRPDVQDAVRRDYAAAAVAAAQQETPARLRGILTRLVSELEPATVEQAVTDAGARRCVRVFDLEPGLARLVADLPTAHAYAIHDRLTEQARLLPQLDDTGSSTESEPEAGGEAEAEPRDERTLDQLRADILTDLLLTGVPAAHGRTDAQREQLGLIRGRVTVTIPATTLARASTGGALVPGHGPIDDETAMLIAGLASVWTRVFTDPVTGTPVAVDGYPPCMQQRRWLLARDERCRFPGCTRPAAKSDIDHTIAREHDGPTALWNLAHLCEHHHIIKHNTDWRVEQRPGGILIWTGPTHRTYVDRPPGMKRAPRASIVRFDPDDRTGPPPREPAEYGDDPGF